MRVAISQQKGGVGKTTITINVAGALAERGHDVAVVDLDPQGHATEGLGFGDAYEDAEPHFGSIMGEISGHDRINDVVRYHDEMRVIPSNLDMFTLETELTGAMRARERLSMVLDALEPEPDFVLIDCPPSLGHLTDNAILASQHVLVPALAEGTSIRALEILFDQVDSLRAGYDVDIEYNGLVANRVEQDGEAAEMMEWFQNAFEGRMPVWEVRKRVALKRAWNEGVSIFGHDEECDMESVLDDIAQHLEVVADE